MENSKRNINLNSGLTLIEIIVAIAIISTGLLGILQMHMLEMKQLRYMQETYIVERLIENEWQQLQARQDIYSISGKRDFGKSKGAEKLRNLKTQLKWKAVENKPDLYEAELYVRWFSTVGKMRTISREFLIYCPILEPVP